ncbi:hypothetical protein BGZ98_004674, partial [Dissophora globulifera]
PGSANNSPYGNYGTAAGGQGSHHQYSPSGYDDMSGAGLQGMGGLGNDPYGNNSMKYGNPGMQGFLHGQQQADKSASAGAQGSNVAGGASLQGQQGINQGQQGYYQQQMFSNYQYPTHHQGYHPNQHQGQHQGSGRNSNTNNNQQFWSQN